MACKEQGGPMEVEKAGLQCASAYFWWERGKRDAGRDAMLLPALLRMRTSFSRPCSHLPLRTRQPRSFLSGGTPISDNHGVRIQCLFYNAQYVL